MIVPFRQGIVKAPFAGTSQNFLTTTANGITLNATSGEIVFNFSHRDTNYLHYEKNTIVNAWTKPENGVFWIYVDIDIRSGLRTFGVTLFAPVVSTTQPPSVPGTMWFNLVDNVMYVCVGSNWVECIRLVIAKINGNTIQPFNGGTSFLGSQTGSSVSVDAGTILIGSNNVPLKKGRSFLTTADTIYTSLGNVVGCRLESLFFEAQASEPMVAFTVVELYEFGKLRPLGTDGLYDSAIGMIVDNVDVGDFGRIIPSGIIENPNWNWEQVSAPLYSNEFGQLTEIARPGILPVAFVVEPNKVMFVPSVNATASKGSSATANNVKSYMNAVGTIDIDEDVKWHTIQQAGPLNLQFNIPSTADNLIQFTIEIISNGSVVNWEADNSTTQGDYVGSVDIYNITYRPARGSLPATLFKEVSHF